MMLRSVVKSAEERSADDLELRAAGDHPTSDEERGQVHIKSFGFRTDGGNKQQSSRYRPEK